jgi:AcrR family transcriptional regulator
MATRPHSSRGTASGSGVPPGRRSTRRAVRAQVSSRAAPGSDGPTALRKRPRQARAQATFDAVLEAAAALIARQGYAATTTNHIAARAGVSVGSLYQYFPNKTAILVGLLERHIREMQPAIAAALADLDDSSTAFEDGLRRLFVRLLAMHDEHPRLHEVLSEEVPHPPSIQRLRKTLEGGHASKVAEILRRRMSIDGARAGLVAQVTVVVAEAFTYWLAHSAPPAIDRHAYVDETVKLLTAYVGAAPAATRRP